MRAARRKLLESVAASEAAQMEAALTLKPQFRFLSGSSDDHKVDPRPSTGHEDQPWTHRPQPVSRRVEELLGARLSDRNEGNYFGHSSSPDARKRMEDVAMEEALKMEQFLTEQSNLLRMGRNDDPYHEQRLKDSRVSDQSKPREEEPRVRPR